MLRVHVVGAGESPESIARLYGVDPTRLVEANPHKPLDGDDWGATFAELAVDEPLYVPVAPPACACAGGSGMQGDSAGTALPQNSQQVISDVLQQAGVSQAGVQSAITSYTGIGLGAQNAVLGIAQGGPITLTSTAPIVAAGLAFIPAIGPAIAGAYLAALPVLNAIGQLFSSTPATCGGYMVGAVCFNKPRPYGPFIPSGAPGAGGPNPDWTTWETFTAAVNLLDYAVNPQGSTAAQVSGSAAANGIVAGISLAYMTQLGPQLEAADVLLHHNHTTGSIVLFGTTMTNAVSAAAQSRALFLLLYGSAWKKNTEVTINGYQAANPYDLFKSVAAAWNATHAPTSNDWTPGVAGSPTLTGALGDFVLTGITVTLPDGSSSTSSQNENANLVVAETTEATANKGYLDSLVNGGIDGQQYVPVTIHMGAVTAPASSSSSTSPVVYAVVPVVAAGAGALAWLALGKPATWSANKSAISALFD